MSLVVGDFPMLWEISQRFGVLQEAELLHASSVFGRTFDLIAKKLTIQVNRGVEIGVF